jgi:hypothetical protein
MHSVDPVVSVICAGLNGRVLRKLALVMFPLTFDV